MFLFTTGPSKTKKQKNKTKNRYAENGEKYVFSQFARWFGLIVFFKHDAERSHNFLACGITLVRNTKSAILSFSVDNLFFCKYM